MSHKKFGPDRFSRFDVYWIQTNKQTDRQAKPNLYIDAPTLGLMPLFGTNSNIDLFQKSPLENFVL